MHRRPVAFALALLVALMVLAPGAASATSTPTPPAPSATPTAAVPPATGPFVGLTLVDSSTQTAEGDDTPVPGVTLTVTTPDGEEVGTAVTDADGRAFIPLPSTGQYVAELDESTLPDGVEVADPTLDLDIKTSQAYVLFPIGVAEQVTVPFVDRLLQALAQGIKLGLIIAMAALGLSLIFGTTGLTNFAHGELMTFGAFVTYVFNTSFGMPVIPAVFLALLFGGLFGWLNERVLWRPLRKLGVSLIAMMIVSIGLSLFLRSIYQFLFGAGAKPYSQYVSQRQKDLGLISLTPKDMWVIAICIVTIAIVCTLLMTTRIGKATRAVSDNPALAASSGLRVDGVISNVWILGTAITALAGALMAVINTASFNLGFNLLLLIFAGVTLGGLGTIWGALFGSLIIGITVQVGPIFGVPESIKYAGALAILILVLLIRPQGILGRRDRIG